MQTIRARYITEGPQVAKWVRLWGKKRGSRMSGWWVVGSVSEAAFFGALFILGILSLTTVAAWQLFWPESTILPIGFGFWLMVIAASSFIVIGLTGFILQVSQTLASPELRSTIVDKAKRDHKRRSAGVAESTNQTYLPHLDDLTDSPGTRLTYRLAQQSGERTPMIMCTLFTTAWNSMLAMLAVISLLNHLSGNPDWFLTVLLVPFGVVSYFATRWFFRLFRRHAGIGPTAVEISDLPLLPGNTYQLYLCQYGRANFKHLSIRMIGYEESTYHQGTDVRTERVEMSRIDARCLGESAEFARDLKAEADQPLELDCQISLPIDMMHSFQGQHHAVGWKRVVAGDAVKWPTFCRSFPVVVYPRDVR
ncbi:MAG: hypothetical protein R3C53_00110 [Pirellulaceae bacterium]